MRKPQRVRALTGRRHHRAPRLDYGREMRGNFYQNNLLEIIF
jgi:hypothetical protein